MKASIGNTGAAGEIEAFESLGGVYGNMSHAAVLDVFAVAERQTFEFASAYDCAWRKGWLILLLGRGRSATVVVEAAVHLSWVCLKGWSIGDDPAYNACEEVVADFAAVAEVDFFQAFCFFDEG